MNEPPVCDKCGSTNMTEQPNDIFLGLFLCQEPSCDGMCLTDAGAEAFGEELHKMWLEENMRVTGNN